MVKTLLNTIKSELIWCIRFRSRCQAEHAITSGLSCLKSRVEVL